MKLPQILNSKLRSGLLKSQTRFHSHPRNIRISSYTTRTRVFSTAPISLDGTSNHENIGQDFYNQAKQHLQNHNQTLAEREETNRQKQYQKPGIAVVKTIAKQTRQQTQEEILKMNGSTPGTTTELEKAQECMQVAAFVHGYPDALVSLANHALSTKEFDAMKEYKFLMQRNTHTYNSAAADTILNLEGLENKKGVEVARTLYEYAGRAGSKEGWFNLGHLYWTGHAPDIEPCQEAALECFEKAAALGDDDARYFLSVHFLGQEVNVDRIDDDDYECYLEDDRKRGLMLLQEAGDNGHAGALYYIALLYRNGDIGLEIEPCTTLYQEYLDEAAEGGDGDALFLKAHCMYNGEDGYEMDKRKAVDFFVEAGEAGNPDGFVSAGAIYHHGGLDIKQDQRLAFELYQRAGELGSAEGWKNVVACYALGEGVPKCEKTAKYISKTMLNDEQER